IFMVMIVSKRAGAVLAAAGLCVAVSLPALSQGFGLRIDGDRGSIEVTPPQDERGNGEDQRRHEERGDAEGHRTRGFGFHFNDDERGNVEGKRAACETYARVALVQAEANRKYRCGYTGPRWEIEVEPHFHWCRHVRRESLGMEARERAGELQRCFDRLGDFDDEGFEHRR
ncbi:MAG TPA: hypothetical protein VNR65_18025, partial [Geobacterales bacterium]|nr:hypothetical protein [Geobacterales bacterium]